MNEEVYEIGNGQMCETGLHTTCGTLDCMHDQKALLIRGENGRSSDSVRAEKSRQVSESTWRHLSDPKHDAGGATATVHIERKRNDKESSYQKTNPVRVRKIARLSRPLDGHRRMDGLKRKETQSKRLSEI